MKPFDLEAAKRGEQVLTESGNPVRFVGTMSTGWVVVEYSGNLGQWPEARLRMTSNPVTIYVVVHCYKGEVRNQAPASRAWFETEDEANHYIAQNGFGGITKVFPVEIKP